MEFSFITNEKYSQKKITVENSVNPIHNINTNTWIECDLSEIKIKTNDKVDLYVNKILEVNSDMIDSLKILEHKDIGQLGNILFKVEGVNQSYVLKALSLKEQNKREVKAWKLLGYNENTGTPLKERKGLPKFIYINELNNFVLMPYYTGVLKPVTGGAYEFPMVITTILSLFNVLKSMHDDGLMYMDLCPDNIMFELQSNNDAISFYLTDMGGVRPICNKCLPDWKKMNQDSNGDLCFKRWTREEVIPPESLFPNIKGNENGCPSVIEPNYDYYTLAKTAMILAGFLSTDNIPAGNTQSFSDDFILEDPLEPRSCEVNRFLNIIYPVLNGKDMDVNLLSKLFQDFFLDRIEFVRLYLQDTSIGEKWKSILFQRAHLYITALKDEDQIPFIKKLEVESLIKKPNSILNRHMDILDSISKYIQEKKYENADQALIEISTKRLYKVSRIAKYSYGYHRKLIRMLNNGIVQAPLLDSTAQYDLPEKKTISQLRQNRNMDLKILKREIQ